MKKLSLLILILLIAQLANAQIPFQKSFGGTNTSWGNSIQQTNDNGYISVGVTDAFGVGAFDVFAIKTDSSGIGPSDHTSFYLKNIPVLHFFTGQHSDYHKPSDDVEKINFEGEQIVLEYILSLLDTIDHLPRLQFLTTRNAEQTKSSFKVTLGIMPDYAFEGKGLRVDGVTEGKAASKAGLKQGDIIIKLGNYSISEIQEYMKALSHFSKGETITIEIVRGKEVLNYPLTF